jgi:hypothetical protein
MLAFCLFRSMAELLPTDRWILKRDYLCQRPSVEARICPFGSGSSTIRSSGAARRCRCCRMLTSTSLIVSSRIWRRSHFFLRFLSLTIHPHILCPSGMLTGTVQMQSLSLSLCLSLSLSLAGGRVHSMGARGGAGRAATAIF